MEASAQVAIKKIRDEMEVDGNIQTKDLAKVGSSQPRQSL